MRAVWKDEPSQELCWLSRPFDNASCSAFTATRAFLRIARRISGVVTIAQAAPSDTPQQSNRPSGSAIIGAARIVSMETALLICALGLFMPFWWLFHETWAMARFRSAIGTPWTVE